MCQKYIRDVGDGFYSKNISVSLHFENFCFFSSLLTTAAKTRTHTDMPLVTHSKLDSRTLQS